MYGREEPFTNVESVRLENGYLSKDFGQLKKWFPKLQILEFYGLDIEDPECIEDSFPLLMQLFVNNPKQIKYEYFEGDFDNKGIFTNSNLRIFFKLNPQLQSLSLMHDVDDKEGRFVTGDHGIKLNKEFLHCIQRKLPQLEKLELKVMQSDLWKPSISCILFPQLQQLRIHCDSWSMLRNIPIRCRALIALHLICENNSSINYKDIADVVEMYPNITVLVLFTSKGAGIDLNNNYMIALANKLPNLREFKILYWNYDVALLHEITLFMSQCKLLTKFVVLSPTINREQFKQAFQKYSTVNQLPAGLWKLSFSSKKESLTSYGTSFNRKVYSIVIEKEN